MGIKKTLGGDRLGSGNRMKQEMHDFYRSNKNLSTTCATTMAPGILYPVYTNIAVKGDTFDMDINSFIRTIPTIGPLYGSFKFQLDVFQVPIRLYQAILHNNTTDIARKMNQVLLPKIKLSAKIKNSEVNTGQYDTQINESALMRFLNISGLGYKLPSTEGNYLHREFTALPLLSYYDIFKNYYANKQEENAYVITPKRNTDYQIINQITFRTFTNQTEIYDEIENNEFEITSPTGFLSADIEGVNLDPAKIFVIMGLTSAGVGNQTKGTLQELKDAGKIQLAVNSTNTKVAFQRQYEGNVYVKITGDDSYGENDIELRPFELENIDNMRKYLLTQWDLMTRVVISEENEYTNMLPYSANTEIMPNGYPNIKYPLNGLCVKCYQSDMFNNWLDSEWVNEITETSAIDVSNGSFTLDTLNFKKKLYDHLNRLAISGGTYDDWQEATYGDRVWGKSEKPIYCGGMSAEVVFDEVISTAATQEEPLGTIGGQGQLASRKGGNITIKVGEASVIMAIASLTPRLFYTQGNAWYNTELDSIDDLHKPIFDRIGFQDLITEQMAWFGTGCTNRGTLERHSAGKQPAWIHYATDIDRAYGDFAKPNGLNYMVLSRNYEQGEDGNIKDITTYIDPRKFNYAFAYADLNAQNFWAFMKFNIHARRKMSNTQIPNV